MPTDAEKVKELEAVVEGLKKKLTVAESDRDRWQKEAQPLALQLEQRTKLNNQLSNAAAAAEARVAVLEAELLTYRPAPKAPKTAEERIRELEAELARRPAAPPA
jgi:chromosome segregation ATPase